MPEKETPAKKGAPDETIVIPSNEEVLEVTETPEGIDVVDVGSKESARIIEDWPEAK